MTVSPMLQRILYLGFEGEFYCKECNEGFHYKSRLERHIQSSSHKAFVDAMERQRASTIEVNNAVLMHAM